MSYVCPFCGKKMYGGQSREYQEKITEVLVAICKEIKKNETKSRKLARSKRKARP